MEAVSSRGLWAIAIAAGLLGAGAIAFSGSAAAEQRGEAGATITMELDGAEPVFEGPRRIARGETLEVLNQTDPQQIGPHTFTLVTKNRLPDSRADVRRCGRFRGVCGKVAKAHRVDPRTFEVGRPNVDAGRAGWNRPFGKKRGDSWYTETAGEATARAVTAQAGKTLRFFCVVHPQMQGKIRVTG